MGLWLATDLFVWAVGVMIYLCVEAVAFCSTSGVGDFWDLGTLVFLDSFWRWVFCTVRCVLLSWTFWFGWFSGFWVSLIL